MQAGTFAIGHHQNFEQMNVFIAGKVLIFKDDGSKSVQCAPQTFMGRPGRKVGLILEDMIWQNVYPNPDNETDIEKLEAKWLTKSESWKENAAAKHLLEVKAHEEDRSDYLLTLHEFGISEETALTVSHNASDYQQIPCAHVVIADSAIQGKGLFATSNIPSGSEVMLARLNGMRTQAGRYTNHSKNPNCEMRKHGDDVMLVAIRDISGRHGGENGEELTIDYRAALRLAGRTEICLQ